MADPLYSAEGSRSNLLQSVLRRWPLVLIGVLVGLVIGFLLYSTQPPAFQSNAQLQVIKKDNIRMTEMRFGYIDDYVATQLDVIRSEVILTAAGNNPKMQETSAAFQERLKANAWGVLKSRLTATRNRDTAGGAMGNSIVNLTLSGDDARDTQIALEAIIDTFQKALSSRTDESLKSTVSQLESARDNLRKLRDKANQDKSDLEVRRAKISKETPEAVTQRWATNRSDLSRIDLELAQLNSVLALIEKSGKNRIERAKMLAILTGTRRAGADPTSNTLEGNKLALELKRKQFADTLGPDHQQMKEIDSQLALVNQEMRRLNPDDPDGEIDELGLHQASLLQKKMSFENQKSIFEDRIKADRGILDSLTELIPIASELEPRLVDLNKRINELENQINTTNAQAAQASFTLYEAAVLNKPQSGTKIGPVLLTWLLPGAFLGGLLGAGLSLLAELRDKSFRSPAEIRERLGVPVIGHLPTIRTNEAREADVSPDYDPTLVAALRPRSVESEAYRGVRTQVLQMSEEGEHQIVQVTSPTPGDGKSTLAANLAISLAQSGKRTVLLDCDFRKPRVHKLFALPKPEVGLASVTSGVTPLDEAIRHSDVDNLDLLPCGPRPANPAELLSGPRFQEVLTQLKAKYDMVIIDTPPILAVSDPRVVAQRVDGVVLVFRITNKVRPLAERAKEYLSDMGATLLGIVVNGGEKTSEYGYGYGYGAGYNYTYDYDYQYAEGDDEKSKF